MSLCSVLVTDIYVTDQAHLYEDRLTKNEDIVDMELERDASYCSHIFSISFPILPTQFRTCVV